MEDLIRYFKDKLEIEHEDLLLPEEKRIELYTRIDMLKEIEEIADKGFPNDRDR